MIYRFKSSISCFFNKLWTATHTPSMNAINLSDETPISMDVRTLGGRLTDNMYENLRFGFMDTIRFICLDIPQYKATVELTEKVKPQPKPEEPKDGRSKEAIEQSARRAMEASASLLGMIGLLIMKQNRK